MPDNDWVLASEGDFFTQEEWSSAFAHLMCVDVADLPLPEGDLNPIYCPDPALKGRFRIKDYVRGEPGAASTTFQMPLSIVSNYLLEVPCPFNGWITYNCTGTRGLPENYQLGVLLYQIQRSNSSILASAVAREPGQEGEIMTNAEVSYENRLLFYQLSFARQSLSNTAAANAISFLPMTCGDKCTSARDLCEEGYLALDGTLYNSEVKYTRNGGSTWTACTDDPFMYDGGDASDVVTIQTATGHKAIVSRGSATVGEPAEVAITTNWGAAWTQVDVGAALQQYITRLFLYAGRIWATAYGAWSGGYIYRSEDEGDTWTAIEAGVETAQVLNDICMYSLDIGYAVGNNNTFLYTLDGDEWISGTGPAAGVNLLSVAVNDNGDVFVGAADGSLYRSEDRGTNWLQPDMLTAGAWRAFGAGSIDRIRFDESIRYVGVLVHNTAAGVGTVYRSHDGGATWQPPTGQAGAWNSGLNDVWICDQNDLFTVGETHGGTTFVAHATQTVVTA